MKKIKYLIFLLPLLFITNVNATCTNYADLDNSTKLRSITKLSSTSFEIYNWPNSGTYGELTYPNLKVGTSYILSFDITSIDTSHWDPSWTTTYGDNFLTIISNSYINFESLNGTINSSTRNFKVRFTFTQSNFGLTIRFKARNIPSDSNLGLAIDNFYLYEESEYDSCINVGSTPTPTTYTYTFKVDNEVYSTGTVEEGTNITLPETNPTKEGYTFTGWTLNGESYTGGEIHSNIEIIANFTENQVEPSPEPETPQETSEIDVSGLIPYLLLIASLVMLFIEINFIKSLLKSRR